MCRTTALIHKAAHAERACRLPENVAQERIAQEVIELVQNWSRRLVTISAVAGNEADVPIMRDDRIRDARDDFLAVGVVGQKPGDAQQGRRGGFHECPERVAQDLLRAIGNGFLAEDVQERGDDVAGDICLRIAGYDQAR